MRWQTDIQANILRGLPARQARYLFLEVDTRAHLRELIRTALPFVRTAEWQRDHFPQGTKAMDDAVLNLAFTRQGLYHATGDHYESDERRRGTVKGADPGTDAFSGRLVVPGSDEPGSIWLNPKAKNSMYRRLDLLGEAPRVVAPPPNPGDDPEVNETWTWDPKWLIHVLAWISGPTITSLQPIANLVTSLPGVHVVHQVDGAARADHVGLFGFVDGVNQPAVEGFHTRSEMFGRGAWSRTGWRGLKPGEFIVGEEDEGGEIRRPTPGGVLHHSTYLAFRQIQMYPHRLQQLLTDYEGPTGRPADEIASWLVGRHRPGNGNDGTSLMVDGPEEDRDFIYGHDPQGFRCPLGAHIRRANPRDTLGKDGRRSNRHRIIRRGMPYWRSGKDGDVSYEPGLAFIALQARIEDQFEFVQGRWLNSGPTLHVGEDPDPIAGNPSADVTNPQFVRQGVPETIIKLSTGQPLTAVRGGEYFVMPALPGLREMADA